MSTHTQRDLIGLPRLLRERASRHPSKVALVEASDITYAELWHRVTDLAQSYASLGLRPGDRIVIALENSSAYVIAYYAALAAHCVPVALNPLAKAAELARATAHSGARLLVARAENRELEAWLAACPGIPSLLACGERSPAIFRLGTSAFTLKAHAANSLVRSGTRLDSLAALVYTSGTTAEPKAVMLSHRNLLANVESIVQALALTSDERCLVSLPFFYAYGASVLHSHLAVGATLILEERTVYPAKLLARIAEQGATSLPLVPSMLPLLFRCGALGSSDLSSLRRITLAGGTCRPLELVKLHSLLPSVEVFVMYGQTEATARLTCLPAELLEGRINSVGRAIPGVQVEVRGAAGEHLSIGNIGDVYARGPSVMLGYYRDPAATAAVLQNGWLKTGDLGYLDGEGFLHLHGRRTDIIKTGAHRVNPHEIEEVLCELEDVEDAVVTGVPDDIMGEVITARVQTRHGSPLSVEEVQRHCRARLCAHKLPRRVELVVALPRTASGKTLRRRFMKAS
ncbi:MAG TPA: class I adenylate-forming enzyme family protein [Polyangiaceae bacterium]|nr:class I adenylate-forming enzyme family protein [Polyangiaceae bacterium]